MTKFQAILSYQELKKREREILAMDKEIQKDYTLELLLIKLEKQRLHEDFPVTFTV